MLTAQLFGTGPRWRPLGAAFAVLWQAESWRQELIQLLELLAELCERRLHPLPWALPVPLRVHGRTSRAEIMAAFGVLDASGAPRNHREGVLWHQPSQCDLLFITLNKSEALFSPSTRYRDLALGPSLFHWESQSNTRAVGITEPFRCLGFARYEGHEGERILFVGQWRFAGGWSGRSRRGGCQAVAWHNSGVGGLRGQRNGSSGLLKPHCPRRE